MASLSFWFLLACLSVVVKHSDSRHSHNPGNCDYLTYCRQLRQAGLHPIGTHPLTCPDPVTCNRVSANFARRPRPRLQLQELPSNRRKMYQFVSGCQFGPHCQRYPQKRPSYQQWPKDTFKVPVRCDFVAYCDALKRHNLNPIANHPGTCPDAAYCDAELQQFAIGKIVRVPFKALPTVDPNECEPLGCSPGAKRKPLDQYRPAFLEPLKHLPSS